MKTISLNLLKLLIGFLMGFFLIYLIQNLHFFWINIIQFVFYLCLYSLIDMTIKRVNGDDKKWEE